MSLHRGPHGAWHSEDAQALATLLTEGSTRLGIAFLDPQGTIRGWTESAHAITGFEADEVLGQPSSLFFVAEDVDRGLHAYELQAARALGMAEDERWHVRKDGSVFWTSGLTIALSSGGVVDGFVKLFRNASHLRLRMDHLQNEANAQVQARQEREVFLATVAHELRGSLHPMTMAVELISRPAPEPRNEQAVKVLGRQLANMGRLVEDLLDLARINRSNLALVHQRVELQRLLLEAVDAQQALAQSHGVELVCLLPPVAVTVEVDPGRIEQVLANLIGNALKFTPRGGRVSLTANIEHAWFTVKVRDTGRGIAPALQASIFDMFAQADTRDTARGQGLGIGLALVKQIVSLHGGTVEVKSEGVGKGSEFQVRLPLFKPR